MGVPRRSSSWRRVMSTAVRRIFLERDSKTKDIETPRARVWRGVPLLFLRTACHDISVDIILLSFTRYWSAPGATHAEDPRPFPHRRREPARPRFLLLGRGGSLPPARRRRGRSAGIARREGGGRRVSSQGRNPRRPVAPFRGEGERKLLRQRSTRAASDPGRHRRRRRRNRHSSRRHGFDRDHEVENRRGDGGRGQAPGPAGLEDDHDLRVRRPGARAAPRPGARALRRGGLLLR